MLNPLDSVYLDHAGSTVCAKSLMDSFASEMTSVLYGNPHSASWPSQLSTSRIEDIRLRLLIFFKADPADYDLVFVPNATAGVKLVVEGMRSLPQGYAYAHHQACHTSLVGVREEAVQSVCLSDEKVNSWLEGEQPFEIPASPSATLFAYSAQSHMDGKRYPLSWSKGLKDKSRDTQTPIFTLLDAASFSATSPLDLSHVDFEADFTVLSLYKIFGFPDLGALIVRRSAQHVFNHRKYFGGGTVDMVVCGKEQWHASKSTFLHERLEDGTLPFHSIMAVDIAMQVHRKLFGSMEQVSSHTTHLTRRLLDSLRGLLHGNGQPVCTTYTEIVEGSPLGTGPVVSFNVRNISGAWVSLAEFDKLATLRKMHVRTGGLCSPGGIASALGLEPWEMKRNFSAGFRCGADNDILAGKPTGVIRASLGAMSTISDVDRFVDFMKEFFTEQVSDLPVRTLTDTSSNSGGLRVKTITVYPIKSCGGIVIPAGSTWEIRPEGLAWDREWCLIHRGSGQALSQKRHPKMALLQPSLDFETGVLVVQYRHTQANVSIPLSENPALFDNNFRHKPSLVCGEEVSAETYISEEINDFFTNALGVPCVLVRFPPGGRGLNSRLSKARVQRYQQIRVPLLPGSFPDMPSPPDSDSEQQGKILLSNESPILMIHSASVDALNEEIESRGGVAVHEASFRANVVVDNPPDENGQPAFSEDSWSAIRIGSQKFKLLGACRRCQMVCVNQETGEKKQEPFSTMAKTRRFDGKVYFGAHMRHEPEDRPASLESQYPTIQLGELVVVDGG